MAGTGAIPVPTVTVWMEEDNRAWFARVLAVAPVEDSSGVFLLTR